MAVSFIQTDTNYLNNMINDANVDWRALNSLIEGIYEDIKELDTMWDGPANDEFNKQFGEDREDFLTVCKDIQKYIDKLEYARKEYDNCENKVAEIVNAIRI